MTDPIDELSAAIAESLGANALRLTTVRGGYVGGGQPHPTLDSDPGAIEAMARALLARKVAVASDPTEEPGYYCDECPHAMFLHEDDGHCGGGCH